ncbi:MAG: DNA-directed RNA polymerase subunit omega [Caldicoprobacterales bacterium]|jgi:DNA-directed RNA polymerase subunit omega|nr:DNA-directed RNA polymerase subunit omega [Clostridiales bacterium]
MIYPTLDSLMTKVDSRYTLVVEVAKRARQLVSGAAPLVDAENAADKPVSTAVREIEEGLISYKRTRDGIK